MSNPFQTRKTEEEPNKRTDQAAGSVTLPVPANASPDTASAAATSTDLGLPEVFGRYRILKQLGRGGMGTVYLAHDTHIDRNVALKVPHSNVVADEASLGRFYREARAAGRLQHPNLCPVYDVDEIKGVHYLTMAYIEGQPLSDRATEYVGHPHESAELVRKIALAMAEAHFKGIIHRDLKPANIMMDRRGEPVVMDFGLARKTDADAATQTSQGVILGTPHYMSPEQAIGDTKTVGPASDVYSLGVILYELLTGRVPFIGTVTAVLVQIAHSEPVAPTTLAPGLDARLEAVCLKAMAKDLTHRYATMTEFADALDAFERGGPLPADTIVAAAASQPAGFATEALSLLRIWGWHRGLEMIGALSSDAAETERFLAWQKGDDDPTAAAATLFPAGGIGTELTAWATLGRVYHALSAYAFQKAATWLDRVDALRPRKPGHPAEGIDPVLEANVSHLRGFLQFRDGHWDQALPLLHHALALLGRDHFLTGRLLDTLGEAYASMNNYQAAREFHELAIQCKEQFGDEIGVSFSRCELGRLCMEWGHFDQAEEHLNANLQMVQKTGQIDVEAQVLEYLAELAAKRAECELTSGRRSASTRQLTQAAEWLDWSIEQHHKTGHAILEGLALKQRAQVALAAGDASTAEASMTRATPLLTAAAYAVGLAEYRRVLGLLRRSQGRFDEALDLFQHALSQFDAGRQMVLAARTQLEIARTRLAAKAMPRMVTQAFIDALQRAELCRRPDQVQLVEEELNAIDPEAHARHVFRRVRGPLATVDTTSLTTGTSEQASVLVLDVKGFLPFCQGMDPGEVMVTLNQMMADFEVVLLRHKAQVTASLGGGFIALLLGPGHAERAVDAALELLRAVAEFNRPREVLELRLIAVRTGVASGPVSLGNIGTYRKMDFTAIGPAVNLASRLVRQSDDGSPCISEETHSLVKSRFLFKPNGPRIVDIKGIGERQVWDVIGRTKERPSWVSRS